MYAILLLPEHGDVTLVTEFSSRREFLSAMGLPDTPRGWKSAIEYERAVYEITGPDQIDPILEEIWSSATHRYSSCANELSNWAHEELPRDRISIRRTRP